MTDHKKRWIIALAVLMLTALPTVSIEAQGNSRTFPETGKTVQGKFLAYWDSHGGLAQQGFPISDEMTEISDTDGKPYTVQYFERAVFEAHPEFAPPNDVLLSLLGVFLYKQKYPTGAPGQLPNSEAGSRTYPETGKRVGGLFLQYWNTHGGLAQQGLPISDEFIEVSDLNGQSYKVQYFERAVFEYHPENPAPFNVLLSQLGTFRYRAKYLTPATPIRAPATNTPVAAPATNTPVAAPPTNTPVPPPPAATNTPAPSCDTSGTRNGSATPPSGKVGTTIYFRATGFRPGEEVSFWFTLPDGRVFGTARPVPGGVNPDGSIGPLPYPIEDIDVAIGGYGRWAVTFQGASSGNVAVIYWCIER